MNRGSAKRFVEHHYSMDTTMLEESLESVDERSFQMQTIDTLWSLNVRGFEKVVDDAHMDLAGVMTEKYDTDEKVNKSWLVECRGKRR